MDFQLIIQNYFNFMIYALKFIVYIYDQLMNEEIFNMLVTTYIGVSALIIALGIFAMDKGNIDKRSIFKTTLIKESKVYELIKKVTKVFILILIQILIPSTLIVFAIRIIIFIYTMIIVVKVLQSFKNVIEMIIDDDKKNKYIYNFFKMNVRKYNQKTLEYNQKMDHCKKELGKISLKNKFIGYQNGWIMDFNNEYDVLLATEEGNIVGIDFNKLKFLNNKIAEYLTNNNTNKTKIKNNEWFILKKLIGEKIEKNEAIIYIRKELKNLNINYKDYYEVKKTSDIERSINEKHIMDVFQEYIDNINNRNIFGIKSSKETLIILYEILIEENGESFLSIYRENIINIYMEYKKNIGYELSELSYKLMLEAQNNDRYDDFENYYRIYFYLKKEFLEDDNIDELVQNIKLTNRIIDRNINIKNKENYKIYFLSIIQIFFRDLFNSGKYSQILKINLNERDISIYQINSSMDRILNYENYPERYKNLDLEEAIKKENEIYNTKIKELNSILLIWLSLAEWCRYKYFKCKSEEMKKFINDILINFKYHSIDDLIELYLDNTNNRLIKNIEFWEFDEPENKNKVITLQLDVFNIIVLLIITSYENYDMKKIKFKRYLNKDNLSFFENLKLNLENINELNLEIINITLNTYQNKKTNLVNYLQDIIKECENDRNKYIQNFKISQENELIFKNYCIEYLKKAKENSKLFKFFEIINKIEYSNEIGQSFKGISHTDQKGFIIYDVDRHIENESKRYSDDLIDSQVQKIIKDISNKAIYTKLDLKEIIKNFKNKDKIYILTPYSIPDLGSFDCEKQEYYYRYLYEDKFIDIPVIEHSGLRNEIIICDIDSIGYIKYFKVDKNKIKKDDIADEYTIADFKDFANHPEIIDEILNENKKEGVTRESLEMKYNIKLYQDVRYISAENGTIYKKKIRE